MTDAEIRKNCLGPNPSNNNCIKYCEAIPNGSDKPRYTGDNWCRNEFPIKYCNSSLITTDDFCIKARGDLEKPHPSWADISMQEYCENPNHINENICGCYEGFGLGVEATPACYYKKCISGGYIPNAQQQIVINKCPDICSFVIKIGESKRTYIADNTFKICNEEQAPKYDLDPATGKYCIRTVGGKYSEPTCGNLGINVESWTYIFTYVFLGILLILILMLIVALIVRTYRT